MSQSSWKFEYDSVIRHKNRILNNYLNYSNDDILIKDDLVDFCIHCYHLYEWIKIGVGDEKIKKAVEKYVKSNEYLVLCGGIANHSKHFIVDKYWKGLYNKVIPLRIANSSQVSSSTGFSGDIEDSNINANLSLSIDDKLIVLVDNKRYSLNEIVENSILAWDSFFEQQGMRL